MMTHDDRAAYIRAIIRHRAPEVSDADPCANHQHGAQRPGDAAGRRSASKSWTCSKRWKPSWTSWSRPAMEREAIGDDDAN